MPRQDRLIQTSQAAVGVVTIVNRIFFAACVLGFAASWVFPGFFHVWIGQSVAARDVGSKLAGMRQLVVTGMLMAITADRILVTLSDIIATVRAGDPFIPANALRLRTIGWYLVVLQLVNIPAALIGRLYPAMGNTAPAFDVSISGWIAVLMVFVLSRVFAAGSAMRDDLEGTV
jgi:hypothetical protein